MKTEILLPAIDICKCCYEKCPDDIYDCIILNHLIQRRAAEYVWCWTIENDDILKEIKKEIESEQKTE